MGAKACTDQEKAKQIWKILTNNRHRRGPSANFADLEPEYLDKIEAAIQKEEPIQFVMPAFSIKCWNPLKVCHAILYPFLSFPSFFASLDSCRQIES